MRRVQATILAGGLFMTLLGGCPLDWGTLTQRLAPPKPEATAALIATRYMAGQYPGTINSTLDDPVIVYHFTYQNGVTLWALELWHAETADAAYRTQVRTSLQKYMADGLYRPAGGDEPIDYLGSMAHATLVHALAAADAELRAAGLEAARYFHESAVRTPDGLIGYHDNPQRGRIWADALFMVMPLLAKAGHDQAAPAYYDDVLAQFRGFRERLRNPATGLYHQGWNWHGPGATPGHWGRANGWVAVAMVEALAAIPPEQPGWTELRASYQDFMAAVAARQGARGLWHQLLDRTDSYEETSCTGLLTYALARGVEHGWLPAEYAEHVRRGVRGLQGMVSINGDIEGICPGTGPQAAEADYFNRPPRRNDSHGIGPTLLGLYGGAVIGAR